MKRFVLSDKEVVIPSNKWRRKYECKPNKGDHDWQIHSVRSHMSYRGTLGRGRYYCSKPNPLTDDCSYITSIVKWRCEACQKHEVEYLNNLPVSQTGSFMDFTITKKKLDKYRPTSV